MGTRPDDEKSTKTPGTSAGGGGAPAADRAPDAPAPAKDAPAPGERDRDGGVADEANYMNPKPEDEVAPGADRGRPKQE